MATFGDIQTKVSKRLLDANNTAVSLPDVAAAINDTVKYWKFRRFWFNETVFTSNMTAQNSAFPFPSDFLVPYSQDDGVQIVYGNTRYSLLKISSQAYDNMFLTNGYGLPRVYARVGGQYVAYPIPNTDYSYRVDYLKDYADMTVVGDSNDFTIYAERLITLWTLADLSAEFRQDDKMETYYRARANDEYRQLQVMSDKSNSSGRLGLETSLLL